MTPASPDDSTRPLLGAHCVALCMTMGAHGNDHEPEPPRAWVSASAFCKQGHVHQSGFPHLVIADIRTVQGLSSNNKPLSFTKELKQVLGCLPAIVPFPAAHLTSSRPNLLSDEACFSGHSAAQRPDSLASLCGSAGS